MKILHIITSLENHGAQNFLYNLINSDQSNNHTILTLSKKNNIKYKFLKSNIKVYLINITSIIYLIPNVYRLFKVIKSHKYHIIQTWLYHSDLIGGIIAKLIGSKRIIWTIRGSFDKNNEKFFTKIIVYINSYLSKHIPDDIIYNSHYALKRHKIIGFSINNNHIIYNGIDYEHYLINDKLKKIFLKEHKIKTECLLIGLVARLDSHKNHKEFIDIIYKLKEKIQNFKCLLIGQNIKNNNLIINYLYKLNLSSYFILLDQIDDLRYLYNSLDIHLLTSTSESFPNVVIESMSCGVFNITSNVSDLKQIFNNEIFVYDKNNYNEIINKICEINELVKLNKFESLKYKIREKIINNFSIKKSLSNFEKIWKN